MKQHTFPCPDPVFMNFCGEMKWCQSYFDRWPKKSGVTFFQELIINYSKEKLLQTMIVLFSQVLSTVKMILYGNLTCIIIDTCCLKGFQCTLDIAQYCSDMGQTMPLLHLHSNHHGFTSLFRYNYGWKPFGLANLQGSASYRELSHWGLMHLSPAAHSVVPQQESARFNKPFPSLTTCQPTIALWVATLQTVI